jgi:hypothetical protein
MYSQAVLHHKWNLVPVCSLQCNSAVVIDNKPRRKDILVAAIMLDLCDSGNKAQGVLRKVGFVAKEVFT